MGYYTNYNLSVCGACGKESEIEDRIQEVSGYCGLSFDGEYNCKWYSWFEDMDAISKEFPDVTFFIEGYGEEQGDVWKAIFKNGKSKARDCLA